MPGTIKQRGQVINGARHVSKRTSRRKTGKINNVTHATVAMFLASMQSFCGNEFSENFSKAGRSSIALSFNGRVNEGNVINVECVTLFE